MTKKPETFHLDNGLRVWLDRRPLKDSGACLIINAGSSHDKVPETAHLLEHLQGSAVKEYDDKGTLAYAVRNAETGPVTLQYYFYCILPEDLPLALESIASAFNRPVQDMLEREKSAVRQELIEKQGPLADFGRKASVILHPNHERYFPTLGTRIDSIDKISIDVCMEFWETHYSPSNSVLYIGGEIPADVRNILRRFEAIPARDNKSRKIDWPKEIPLDRRHEFVEKVAQNLSTTMDINYQFPAYPYEHTVEQNAAMSFLKNYLNTSHGPLHANLRDRLGLVYGAGVYDSQTGNARMVSMQTSTKDLAACTQIEAEWIAILKDLSVKGVPRDALEILKKGYKIELIHGQNRFGTDDMMAQLQFGITEEDAKNAVDRVSVEDTAREAKRLLDSNYLVRIALPMNGEGK